jgi:TPR repeat protein
LTLGGSYHRVTPPVYPQNGVIIVAVKAAVLLSLSLCVPTLADQAAGQHAFQNGDYATALKEFLPLATQGNPDAQLNLGVMYQQGLGVRKDYKEAVRWYRLGR